MLKIQSWGRWLSPMTKWMGPWQKWDRRWSKIQDLFSAPQGLLSAYLGRRRLFSSVQIESLLSGKCGNAWQSGFTSERHTDLLAAICGMDPLNAIAHLELDVYMGQTLLRDSDAMGMAHSLEIRVPFLDTKLSGLVLGMPATLRSANPRPKWMLIKAFEQELPKENLQRSKQGFSLPWQQWLDGPLKNTVKEGIAVLSDICEPMSATIVNSVWQKYQANPSRVGWSRPWSLYVLAKYIERNGLKAPQFGDSSQGSMVKSAAA